MAFYRLALIILFTLLHSSAVRGELAPKNESMAASSWWFPNIDLSDPSYSNYAPNLGDDYSYPVYVAVASGDVNGLIKATYSPGPDNGVRFKQYLAAQPRVIYLAPGTYELDSTLYLETDTLIIGDAVNPPTIAASSNFEGSYLIVGGAGDDQQDGGESKFSTVMRNVILDTTANAGNSDFTALSWRVAQNSGLLGVTINLPHQAHTGIYLGQGSPTQVADVTINWGNIGIAFMNMEQITLKNIIFNFCTTGVDISGGSTLNVFASTFYSVGFPVVLEKSGEPWVSVVDSTVINSGVFLTSYNPYPNFMIENINIDSTKNAVVNIAGTTTVPGSTYVPTYVYGNTYGTDPIYQTTGSPIVIPRPPQLAPGGSYPTASADQYVSATVSDVINLKNTAQNGGFILRGDGQTNDGPSLQSALNTAAAQGKIAFLPFGVYLTKSTITIPSGTELVGNGWSTISGTGSAFSDSSNPTPVVMIGAPGETGTAHLQDLRFTVNQVLPGAIIVQVNMAGQNPGDVSIHNSLITVGGTPDSSINCDDTASCQASYISLHLSSTSSAYIDNVWAWIADHSTDGSSAAVAIASKGGVLIEATQGTWLTGLASEHHWLYNVAYNGASNVFNSLLQTETNYNQGSATDTATPPNPWTPGPSDPNFSSFCGSDQNCPMTANQYYNGGSNIFTYASASWNFFGGTQTNVNVMNAVPSNSYLYGLCSNVMTLDGNPSGTQNVMILPDGTTFGNANEGYSGSWGNLVAAFTSSSIQTETDSRAGNAAVQEPLLVKSEL